MNQVTNKVPYGLLSEEEQAQFCRLRNKHGLYQMYSEGVWSVYTSSAFDEDTTYQLIIKDDEWYYGIFIEGQDGYAILGRDLTTINGYDSLRPATPSEIEAAKPKELSLEDRVKKDSQYILTDVEMLEWYDHSWCYGDYKHYECQSMKGFNGYVYENDQGFFDTHLPTLEMLNNSAIKLPIAVLFTKDSE